MAMCVYLHRSERLQAAHWRTSRAACVRCPAAAGTPRCGPGQAARVCGRRPHSRSPPWLRARTVSMPRCTHAARLARERGPEPAYPHRLPTLDAGMRVRSRHRRMAAMGRERPAISKRLNASAYKPTRHGDRCDAPDARDRNRSLPRDSTFRWQPCRIDRVATELRKARRWRCST